MEILIFALIASYNAHRRQKRVVAEPEEFQPFDFQTLRNFSKGEPAGQRHTSLGSSGRSIPKNSSSASSLRPLRLIIAWDKGGPRYKPVSGLLARQSVSRRKVLLDESS